MEFRLTYAGPLYGANGKDTRATHKHEIRKVFHKQLKRLWEVTPHFVTEQDGGFIIATAGKAPATTVEELSDKFKRNGYNFVPLVTEELSLKCDISILFLRPDKPGRVLKSGDIDNRIKTLFDSLRIPKDQGEFGSSYREPQNDERPFYCLLEDDSLITSVAVETDLLLEPTSDQRNANDARLILSVAVRPIRISPYNMHLG